MQHNVKYLYGCKLAALDGDIGHVKDFYFDDKAWVVRYLVADTGSWLSGKQVLLAPPTFGHFNQEEKALSINLTRERIENSPSIERHKPVSRRYEIEYYRYYGWLPYWNPAAMDGLGGYPVDPPPSKNQLSAQHLHPHREDKHLRSTLAVTGYAIHATDGEIGSVSGFMVDDKSWAVRDLVVDTGHWFSSKEVLIAADKIGGISYEDSQVFVNLTKSAIQHVAEPKVVTAGT
ncbi:MAG: PRC-barrel domain-containing protein [Lacunisphaera sp.]